MATNPPSINIAESGATISCADPILYGKCDDLVRYLLLFGGIYFHTRKHFFIATTITITFTLSKMNIWNIEEAEIMTVFILF